LGKIDFLSVVRYFGEAACAPIPDYDSRDVESKHSASGNAAASLRGRKAEVAGSSTAGGRGVKSPMDNL